MLERESGRAAGKFFYLSEPTREINVSHGDKLDLQSLAIKLITPIFSNMHQSSDLAFVKTNRAEEFRIFD